MTNGIIINGVAYETVFVDTRDGCACHECGLKGIRPLTGCGRPCLVFSDEYNYIGAYFRRIKDQEDGKEK